MTSSVAMQQNQTPPVRTMASLSTLLPIRIFHARDDIPRVNRCSFRGEQIIGPEGRYVDDSGTVPVYYDVLPAKKAGNFFAFVDVADCMRNWANTVLRPELARRIRANPVAHRMAFTCPGEKLVGWASSIDVSVLTQNQIDSMQLRKMRGGCTAYYVTDPSVLAPMTSDVAVIAYARPAVEGGWIVTIHDLYPGPFLGNFEGNDNVTERTGRALFNWEHPVA